MTKSRDLGNLAQTVAVNLPTALGTAGQTLVVNSGADGLEFGAASGGSGVTVYTGLSGTDGTPSGATYLLNASSPSAGDLAYVSANTSLYQNNGNGWYRIAVINTTPTISSVADASSNTTPFTLEGGTNTVITVTASDADEGTDLTYSYSVTSGSLNGTTVTQGTGVNENVFTIAPHASNATTFSLTFTVSDSINAATSVAAFTLEFSVTDSHYTTLLMATDGSAGDNNDITDSSSNSHTITVSGDAHAGTFSPYRHGGYSTYFDGSGDYLTISNDTSLNLANTSFTIECWVFPMLDYSNFRTIFSKRVSGSTTTSYHGYLANSTGYIGFYNGTAYESSTVLVSNAWSHCAWVYDGTNIKIFVNGTQVLSQTTSISEIDEPLSIGFTRGYTEIFGGYISDFRIVKGTAVYTSNFTPTTTRLTTVSGTGYSTSLLTCHLPYIADGSSNAHAITVNGNTSTKPFGPYDYDEYDESINGGSVYLDGSDRITAATSSTFAFTGDFTVEFWLNYKGGNGYTFFWTNNSGSGNYIGYGLNTGTKNPWVWDDTNVITTNTSITNDVWQHHALVRSGSTLKIYLDGSEIGSTTSSKEFGTGNQPLHIGWNSGNDTQSTNGYISDFRIVNGTAVYSGAFTPPTGPLTTTGGTYPSTTNVNTSITASNTKLLLKGTDAHVLDKSQVSNLKLVGTAASTSALTSGSTPPYIGAAWANTSAVSFDGDSDYVQLPVGSLDLGSSDFTIEAWIYQETNAGSGGSSHTIYSDWLNTNNDKSSLFRVTDSSGQKVQFLYSTDGSTSTNYTSTATISNSTWTHVAVCKDSTSLRFYKDGAREVWASSPSFTLNPNDGAVGPLIGANFEGQGGNYYQSYFDGYIQDLRVTKGKARYTAADESSNIPSTPLKG